MLGRSVALLLLVALALAPTGILGEPQEETQQWIFFRPPANASSKFDYGVLANRFDFRGSYKFFGLFVGSYDDVLVMKTLYPTAQAYAFALYNASEHLWVAECEARFGSALATEVARALLAAHIPVLKTYKDQSGWMAFVVKGPNMAALHQLTQVVLVPVPRRAQVVLPFEATTLHKLFATGLVDSPLKKNDIIAKLITQISKERLRKNVEHLSSYFTRLSTSQPVREAQAWIARQYAMLGLDVSTYLFKEGFSDNVIAEMRGAVDPSKIVIVSGHYDSRSVNITDPEMRAPGADDNGSGTSNVLELARVFTQSGLKFRHTIRFCSWSGEEQGLVGSRVYAKEMRAQNVDIIAVLNSDMLGWTLPGQPVTLGMKDRYVTPELLSLANNLTQLYVPDLPVGSSPSCCSDHQSFFEQGYPAVGYFENPGSAVDYPHYHKSTDFPEYLNFDQVVLISRAIGAAVATIAVPL